MTDTNRPSMDDIFNNLCANKNTSNYDCSTQLNSSTQLNGENLSSGLTANELKGYKGLEGLEGKRLIESLIKNK